MPNTNVASKTAFWGKSDADRHGLTPARREWVMEGTMRRALQRGWLNTYEHARQRGEVTYKKKEMPR